MGLVTLILLIALTVVYLYNSLETKPEALGKIVTLVNENMKYAQFAAAYALVAAVLCWFTKFALLKFAANILILVMLSPKMYDQYSEFILAKGGEQAKVNAAKIVEVIKKQEEYISYAGLCISVLLFLLLF